MKPAQALARGWRLLAVGGDLVVALVALGLAFALRVTVPVPFTGGLLPAGRGALLLQELGVLLASQLGALYVFGLYDLPDPRQRAELARRLLPVPLWQGLAFGGYLYLFAHAFPRSVLVIFLVLDFLLLLAWRALLHRVVRLPQRRAIIVGRGPAAREIAGEMRAHHWQGLVVAGHVPAPEETLEGEPADSLGPCLGTVDDLPRLLADGVAEDVILAASAQSWRVGLLDRLARSRPSHTNVLLLPGPFESLIGGTRYRSVQDIPLIEVVRESEWRAYRPLKRGLDLVLAVAMAAMAALPMAIVALLVRVTSPGPILYRQQRVGRGQREFTLVKFRTMREDAERDTGEVLAMPGDPRLTPVGAMLRRFRLDELPQLWNVVVGEMSLVGPRPERPGFVQRYLEEVPGYAERFSMQPGLTGLAQVRGEYDSSAENKLRYDLAYIANWSLWLDLVILLRTVKIVLSSRGV